MPLIFDDKASGRLEIVDGNFCTGYRGLSGRAVRVVIALGANPVFVTLAACIGGRQ